MRTNSHKGLQLARKWRVVALSCLGGALGALALSAPAYADDPADLAITIRTPQVNLTAGSQQADVKLTITNNGPGEVTGPVVNVQVPLTSRGVSVVGASVACTPSNGPSVLACQLGAMAVGQSVDFTLGLRPPGQGSIADGETVTEAGNVWITNPNGSDPNNKNDGGPFNAALTTPTAGVSEVSGTVVDGSTGQPIEGVRVVIKDSAGAQGVATTDSTGRFSFRPDQRSPLKPGRLSLQATKDGFEIGSTKVDATRGGAVTDVQLAMSPAAPSPSPSPTPASPSPSPVATPATAKKSNDESSSSLILIVMISVLATGILTGAGLWIGLRRNRDNEQLPPGSPDGPTVQLSREQLARAMAGEPYPGAGATQVYQPGGSTQVMTGATQVYQPASGTEPYQPASGSGAYQPASGGYQPASGYPPPYPPPPSYPPAPGYAPEGGTEFYSPGSALQGFTPSGGQPPPSGGAPAETALFGGAPTGGGQDTTGWTKFASREPAPYSSGPPTSPFGAPPAAGTPAPYGGQATGSGQPIGTAQPAHASADDDGDLTEDPRPGRWLHAVPPPDDSPTRGRHSAE